MDAASEFLASCMDGTREMLPLAAAPQLARATDGRRHVERRREMDEQADEWLQATLDTVGAEDDDDDEEEEELVLD